MEEVREWLKKAEHDLLAAEINLRENLFDISAFLSHQAAEKALKALYILQYKRLWKIHDLGKLSENVGATENIKNVCERLNPHYLAARYPLDQQYTRKDASEALKNSKKVVGWIKAELKKMKE